MKVSLVLGTFGRTVEVERFLRALTMQTTRDWELIVVDQNPDSRVRSVLAPYMERQPITYLRAAPGLSRARNVGVPHATGEIMAFPDDDCWYDPTILERVAAVLVSHDDWDGVTGRAADAQWRPTSGRWSRKAGMITPFNCWWRAVSFTLFVRRRLVERVGPFDESLGVGAGTPWGSAEELDYMIRATRLGCRLYYDPTIVVRHPNQVERYDAEAISRAYRYGMGIGRVLRLHRFPAWFTLYQCLRPLGGAALSAVRGQDGRMRYHWAGFAGRVGGVRSSRLAARPAVDR